MELESLTSWAFQVPCMDVAFIDLIVRLEKAATYDKINTATELLVWLFELQVLFIFKHICNCPFFLSPSKQRQYKGRICYIYQIILENKNKWRGTMSFGGEVDELGSRLCCSSLTQKSLESFAASKYDKISKIDLHS